MSRSFYEMCEEMKSLARLPLQPPSNDTCHVVSMRCVKRWRVLLGYRSNPFQWYMSRSFYEMCEEMKSLARLPLQSPSNDTCHVVSMRCVKRWRVLLGYRSNPFQWYMSRSFYEMCEEMKSLARLPLQPPSNDTCHVVSLFPLSFS